MITKVLKLAVIMLTVMTFAVMFGQRALSNGAQDHPPSATSQPSTARSFAGPVVDLSERYDLLGPHTNAKPMQSVPAPEGCRYTGCEGCGGKCTPRSRFCTIACNDGRQSSACVDDNICHD
jgi:hypothetical protein